MTASLVYVNSSGVAKSITSLCYGSSVAKSIYLGSTLVWQAPSTASWIALPSGNTYLTAYTPTSNMSVSSFSVVHDCNTVHNGICGIWTLSGTTLTPVTNACISGATGIAINAGSVLGSYTQYTITKTYTTKPSLVAGTTYYFYVGERYVAQHALSGSNDCPGYAPDWQFSTSATMTMTAGDIGNLYISVVGG